MVYGDCNPLPGVSHNINYFNLMEISQGFLVDAQFLNKRFCQIQSLVHPDKFGTNSLREQNNSAGWRSLTNKAYNRFKRYGSVTET